MLSALNLRWILDRLAEKRDTQEHVTEQDYLSLGEIIRLKFPAESKLSATYAALAERYEAAREEGNTAKALEGMRDQLASLAASARELIDQSDVPVQKDTRERDSQQALQIVNQAYFESSLFTATKWILAVSLALLGIGSLGFASFNLNAQKQVQEAQKTLTETTNQISETIGRLRTQQAELQQKQDETLASIRRMVTNLESEAKTTLYAAIDNLKKELTDQIGQAKATVAKQVKDTKEAIELEKKTIDEGLVEYGKQARARIDNNANAAVDAITAARTTGIGTIESAIQSGQGAVTQKAEAFANRVDAANTTVEGQKTKFATDLAGLLADAKTKIDNTVPEQLGKIQTAADEGVRRLNGETQSRSAELKQTADAQIRELNTLTEDKKTALNEAHNKNIVSLNEALRGKLAELNAKSDEAQRLIADVSTNVARRETEFAGALNRRLTDWDGRVSAQLGRLEGLAKASTEVETRTKDIDRQLTALQASSKSALEVAAELRSGTKTGELPLIGQVLEKSATLFLVGLVLAGLTLLGWFIRFCIWGFKWQRPA